MLLLLVLVLSPLSFLYHLNLAPSIQAIKDNLLPLVTGVTLCSIKEGIVIIEPFLFIDALNTKIR